MDPFLKAELEQCNQVYSERTVGRGLSLTSDNEQTRIEA